MRYFAIIIIYATAFGTIISEVALHDLGWGPLAASFTWLGGVAISLIPILRTVVLAAALSMLVPWWAAIPAACLINVFRHFLLIIVSPGRREHLEAQKQRMSEYRANEVDPSLSPEAKQQLGFWNAECEKALEEGKERESRVYQAKALIVASTNSPILDFVSGSKPLVCQPGYVENLGDDELDDLIQYLGMDSEKIQS